MTLDARRFAEILLALVLIVGGAKEFTRRLERAAERQILQQLGGRGQVQVHIEPRWGALGVWLARADTITVRASGFHAAQMPFFAETPVPAWRGDVQTVRIVLEKFSLSGFSVRRLEATIPNVSLDSRAAAFRLRIRLFGAGWGDGQVTLDEEDLTAFVSRRLPEVQSPRVRVTPSAIVITGELAALLTTWRFEAKGRVTVREGRELVIEDAQVSVEGESLPPALVQKLVTALNPVLDVERDMRLGSMFIVERAEQQDGFVKLIGRATVPSRLTGGVNGDRKR
jgi:hypothetical protein